MARTQTLLDEIKRDLLDGKPIADLLRKCLLLGSEAGSLELTDWASKELRGYGPDDELPKYRQIVAPLQLDAMVGNGWVKGQIISSSELPDFARDTIGNLVPIVMPIGEVEAMVGERSSGKHVHLQPAGASDLVLYMNGEADNPFQQITSMYWSVAPSALHGIVDNVRTTLTELAGELIRTLPSGHVTPTKEHAHQAVEVAVHGRSARVSVNTAQAVDGSTSTATQDVNDDARSDTPWWRISGRVGAFVVGCAVIVGAVITVLLYIYR